MIKKFVYRIVLFLILLSESNLLISQNFIWEDSQHTPSFESANAIAIDSVNSFLYMGGVLTEPLLGIGNSELLGGKDGLIAKYDFDGNNIWAFNIGGNLDDEVTGIAVDSAGNIYVTGYYTGTIDLTGNTGQSGMVSTAYGGKDIFIASYTPDGALRSYQVLGTANDDAGMDICSNDNGIFVTGFYSGTIIIDGNVSTVPYNNKNIFVAKLDFNLNFLWAINAGSNQDDYPSTDFQEQKMGITADDTNVYVIGMMGGDNFLIYKDGIIQDTLFNADSHQDIFILSLESQTGNLKWAQQIENNADPVGGMGIAVNPNGVYITGVTHNNSVFPGGNTVSSPDSMFIFLSQLDKITGLETWTKTFYSNVTNSNYGYSVATDNTQGIYVIGMYGSNPFYFDNDYVLNNVNNEDAYIVKYSDNGIFDWATNITGNDYEKGLDIVPLNKDNIFVSGIYSKEIYFRPSFDENSSDNDNLFVARLSENNSFQFDTTGCTGDVDNNGIITEINGSSNLTVMSCQHVKICDTIFMMDFLSDGWLDSLTFELGAGYTNISNITPNGTGTGFYENGNWGGTYDSLPHTIYWSFENTTSHPDYGDGYSNQPYSCQKGSPHEYHFCFEADIAENATDSSLFIKIYASDDKWSNGYSITTDSILVHDINISDPPPYFTNCPSDTTLEIGNSGNCSVTLNWQTPSAMDNCPPTVTQISGPAQGSSAGPGNYHIVYVAVDGNNNTDTCSFNIFVEDTISPQITCPGNQTVYTTSSSCDYPVSGTEFDPTSISDNCTVNVVSNDFNNASSLSGEVFPIGNHPITWQIVDNSGNTNTCSFTVTVTDTISPQITCPGNQTVYTSSSSCDYPVSGTEFDPTSISDNCTVNVVSNDFNNASSLSGEVFSIGNHPITWQVVDSSGNTNSCNFMLTVVDTISPSITCQTSTIRYSDSLSCTYAVQGNELDATGNDNCSTFSIINNFNGSASLNGADLPIGQLQITWIITDLSGNQDSCSSSITIVDTIAPVFDWPQDIVTCDSIVFWQPPAAYDNCSAVTVTQTDNTNLSSGDVFPVGTTTIEYTATDSSNNIQTTQFNITVLPPLHPYWSNLPSHICLTEPSFSLNNLVTGDTAGTWLIDGNIRPDFNPMLEGAGIHTVTYHLDNGYCTADSSLVIEVINVPDVDAGNDFDVCGTSSRLQGSVSSGNVYWQSLSGNVLFSPDSTDLNPTITVSNYGHYQFVLTASENINCENADSVTVEFYQMPETVNAGTDQIINITNEAQMNAIMPDIGTGEWSFLQGSGNIQTINDPATFVSNLAQNENILIWTVVNGPCRDSDLVKITVHGIKIPDAFSPNGDGYNDYFVITGIEDYQSEISVFNRWGNEIFHAINYQNNWDGKTNDGKILPNDTYFYILKIDNENYHGSITINR